MRCRSSLVVCALVLLAGPAAAQVVQPAAPEKYDVRLRYKIRTDRDERIRQYRAMTAFLDKLGFVQAPKEDADLEIFDPSAETKVGTIGGENAAKLLDDSRIQSVLLIPADTKLPEEGDKLIPVQLVLGRGFGRNEQRLFSEQTVERLGLFGFRENVGYDSHGFTRIVGQIPAKNLEILLKDLRFQPTGWFAPITPFDQLPVPFRNALPVRLIEVLKDPADLPMIPPAPAQPASPALAGRLSQGLLAILGDEAKKAAPLRVEMILDEEPRTGLRDLIFRVRSTIDGATLEGVVGVTATVQLAKASDAEKLFLLPGVRSLRLPPSGNEVAVALPEDAKATAVSDLLASSRVAKLHGIGYRGEGTRVAILATDFVGAKDLIGKGLPATTRIIDLTAELSLTLQPKPEPKEGGTAGTTAARVVAAAAPGTLITLIRIEPAAFHQLLTVAKAVAGDVGYSVAMQARSIENIKRLDTLNLRRGRVVEEYRQAFSDLGDEPKAKDRRDAAKAAMDALLLDETTFKAEVLRFDALKQAVDTLGRVNVVVNTLVWEAGYPQDGLSELSRFLSENFVAKPGRTGIRVSKDAPVPVWVQAGSDAVGSIWAGPYVDPDGNGVLDFAPEGAKLPAKRWTNELNFLTFAPADGKEPGPLPADYRVKVTIQWREPHDPEAVPPSEPIYPFQLRLLRQLDPEGKVVASDRFYEVARSTANATVLQQSASSAIYEQSVEVTVPAGSYALRVEARPQQAYLLARQMTSEINPRIVVAPADAASAALGTVRFDPFAPRAIGVGIPGDSDMALTIGSGKPPAFAVPLSNTGAGPGVLLKTKPDLLTSGEIRVDGVAAGGTGIAAAYVGGSTACLLQSGVRGTDLIRYIGRYPGEPFVLPTEWLDHIRPQSRYGSERR